LGGEASKTEESQASMEISPSCHNTLDQIKDRGSEWEKEGITKIQN
jgi:hypothetical protein